jgi:hypothetical protein
MAASESAPPSRLVLMTVGASNAMAGTAITLPVTVSKDRYDGTCR